VTAFHGCAEALLESTLHGRQVQRFFHQSGRRYNRDMICRYLDAVIAPSICLIKQHCNRTLANVFYAATYTFAQIRIGGEQENRLLKCDYNGTKKYDLTMAAFNSTTPVPPARYLPSDFCRGVELPGPAHPPPPPPSTVDSTETAEEPENEEKSVEQKEKSKHDNPETVIVVLGGKQEVDKKRK